MSISHLDARFCRVHAKPKTCRLSGFHAGLSRFRDVAVPAVGRGRGVARRGTSSETVIVFAFMRHTDTRRATARGSRRIRGARCAALVALLWLPALPSTAQSTTPQYPFQNPDLPAEERISDLIARMTLAEKIDALAMRASVPRLGVVGSPHIEGYHGVAQGGPSNWGRRNPTATTQFPQAYGLGSTWDPELLRRVAAQEAQEARYLYQSRKYQRAGLIVRAPNADLARDPRWGRTEEVYGEDPFHAGTLAVAFTRGLQGDDPRYWKTAALLKHFLANSNEDAREHSSSDFDERLWREYYAKPFEMAVRQGGSRAMMAAYNAVNGTPAHVHPMLKDVVVREWGLDGILCTDGDGLSLLVTDHKAFSDLPSAAAACIKAGINHFLDRQKEPVSEAVQKGLVSEAEIDEALRGLFRVSIRLGLLDPAERVPYAKIGAEGDPEPWSQPETRAFVREVTRKSIVLLRNSAGLLPLDRSKREDDRRRRPAREHGAARLVLGYAALRSVAARGHRARRESGRPGAGGRRAERQLGGRHGRGRPRDGAQPRRRRRLRRQPSRGQRRLEHRHLAERGQGGRRSQAAHATAGQEDFVRG